MIVESIAIILIIFAIIIVFLRSSRINYALSVLPVVTVPVIHLLSYPTAKILSPLTAISGENIRLITEFAGMALAFVFFIIMSNNFRSRTTKTAYMLLSTGFSLIISLVFIFSTII